MTFLNAYRSYGERLTDAPPVFHVWVGLSILGAALGNGVWVYAWGGRKFPHLWTVLLADSGVFRKTTAINIGVDILREAEPARVYPSEWSFEALLNILASRPAGLLVAREFRRFMAATSREYALGAKEALVDLYDSPPVDERRTKAEGLVQIKDAAPALLSGTTLDWFASSLRAEDIGGGLFSRLLVVTGREPGDWRGLGATRAASDYEVRASLVDHLKGLKSNMAGELDISAIKDPFNEWLRGYERRWAAICPTEMAGAISRSGTTCLKLAMAFQASFDPCNTLSLKAFEDARDLLQHTHSNMAKLVAEGVSLDIYARERQKVLALINTRGRIPHSEALWRSHLDAKRFEGHINTLVQTGDISVENEQGEGQRRPSKVYVSMNGATPQ